MRLLPSCVGQCILLLQEGGDAGPLAVLAAHTAHRSVLGRMGRADRLVAAAADLLEGAVREIEAGAGRDHKVRSTSADGRTVQPVKSLEHIRRYLSAQINKKAINRALR